MKDIRVTKTMVDGKAEYKTININKSASQDDKALVPGGKLLDLGINLIILEIEIPVVSSTTSKTAPH
jgi:ribosomal protein L18E